MQATFNKTPEGRTKDWAIELVEHWLSSDCIPTALVNTWADNEPEFDGKWDGVQGKYIGSDEYDQKLEALEKANTAMLRVCHAGGSLKEIAAAGGEHAKAILGDVLAGCPFVRVYERRIDWDECCMAEIGDEYTAAQEKALRRKCQSAERRIQNLVDSL